MNADWADRRGLNTGILVDKRIATDEDAPPLYIRAFAFFFIVLLPILLPLTLLLILLTATRNLLFLVCLWLVWFFRGKDTLVVYSNSPNWQEYFESAVLPLLENRGEVLNWSEHKDWPLFDWRTCAFWFFSGDREFNPIVIVFKPFRWPQKFRFMQAMHDVKHQKFSAIHKVTTELSNCLKVTVPPPEP